MKEQLWMGLALGGRLRSTCRNSSREAAKQRLEILGKLEALLQSSEVVVQLSRMIFDQAHFQERRDSRAIDSLFYFALKIIIVTKVRHVKSMNCPPTIKSGE